MDSQALVLKAIPRKDGGVKVVVRCPHCKEKHVHGSTPNAVREHRVADCFRGTYVFSLVK